MKEVLRFENVSMHYHSKQGETVALKEVNFSVSDGEFVAIIGPSGCGKTTLLSLAAGLLSPTKGKVVTDNVSFGYMLQKDELFPWRTIEKNIFLPLEIKRSNTPEHRERAIALAEKYGLKQFLKNYPSSLSGGMRQRAALIRTLSVDPDVLLLDEPFSALDYQTRLSVCDDVYKIIRSEKKTALLITHDISEAISLADKIFVLSKRPASIIASHEIHFPETEPLKRRENKEFSRWFEVLWKELNA
ncbi:MAG: ABC transporter ATP-binding protein [Clostridiales bacterium]|nr:ABC transporter ATP-binding protein [Clostridiales bacterium]